MMIWNCRGFDTVESDVSLILKRIGKTMQPRSIILLHDLTPACVEVLEGTLILIRERGYRISLPAVPSVI
jgi:hypothetical protein